MIDEKRVGLTLSGGGVRAMAFHCGVLRWLAENDQLEYVSHISSVSGGSLLVGLIFTINQLRWPSSSEFQEIVEPKIAKLLIESDLQTATVKRLLLPANWQFMLSRANILSRTIETLWGVSAKLDELPVTPVWSVNGTTAETGRRFRFKRKECGDYEVGYAGAGDFTISDVMAVSAAFPVGIGPFVIKTADLLWRKSEAWESYPVNKCEIEPTFKYLHIYDGGVYDNLGLEPLFDIGKRCFKGDVDYVIISDAGSPLARTTAGSALNPFRVKRIADIALDQTRALRVRSFVNFIQKNPSSGIYIQIGISSINQIKKYHEQNKEVASDLLSKEWLDEDSVHHAVAYPTNLKKLTTETYQLLQRHGYETAKWNALLFGK